MLQLQICAAEECNGILFSDVTGPYSESDQGGYGVENGILGPNDFTSYVVRFWKDGAPAFGTPTAEVNLTGQAPTPDDDGHYSWLLSFAQLGIDSIESGVWTVELTATDGVNTYQATFYPIFTAEIEAAIRAKMPSVNLGGKCAEACEKWEHLASLLDAIRCYGPCSGGVTSKLIKYIKTQLKTCC